MRRGRRKPVQVVTDLHEPLVVEHGRRIRIRLVAMVVWIIGWIVAGTQAQYDGWLATAILLTSGPGVWILWWLFVPARRHGHREPVGPRPPRQLPRAPGPETGGD